MKEFKYENILQVPSLSKIMVNVGAGEAVSNSAAIEEIVEMIELITGQKPVVNKARKAIAAFNIREGQEVGVSVTLRGDRMWEFFDRLVNVVFPRTKDFRGVNAKGFDGSGNYSIGILEHSVFPEIDPNKVQKIRSLQVTIVTTSDNDEDGKRLLDKFGFPFKEDGDQG